MVHKRAGIGEVLSPDVTVVADSCFLGRRIKTSKVGQKLFIYYVKYFVFLGFDSLPVKTWKTGRGHLKVEHERRKTWTVML